MCFDYVFVGVLGVGLSMGVVLGLAPQARGVLNICNSPLTQVCVLDIVVFVLLLMACCGLLFFMFLVVGYYAWWRFCFYGFGVPKLTVYFSFLRSYPLQSCLGVVGCVLVCMCVHYVCVGVLGVGLSMGVVLGLAPQVCVTLLFSNSSFTPVCVCGVDVFVCDPVCVC